MPKLGQVVTEYVGRKKSNNGHSSTSDLNHEKKKFIRIAIQSGLTPKCLVVLKGPVSPLPTTFSKFSIISFFIGTSALSRKTVLNIKELNCSF